MPRVEQRRGRARGRRGLAGALVLLLALAPAGAVARSGEAASWRSGALAPVGGSEKTSEPVDIGELWQQAQARIDTAEYGEAIELLTTLYDAIAIDPEAAALRLRVQWALQRAHRGAYGVDGELTHLYVARDLLVNYVEALPQAETERRAEAEAAQQQVQRDIQAREAEDAAVAEAAKAVEARRRAELAAQPSEPPANESDQGPPPLFLMPSETTPAPPDDAHRGLILGGSIGVGLGVVGLAIMAGGLGSANAAIERFTTMPDERHDARGDVERGNKIAVGAGAAGGVLLVGGAVVLALGLRRRAKVREGVVAGPVPLGLGWRLRF